MFDNSIFMKNKSDKCKIKIKIECCTKNETIGVCPCNKLFSVERVKKKMSLTIVHPLTHDKVLDNFYKYIDSIILYFYKSFPVIL